jgi:hypothetical protein
MSSATSKPPLVFPDAITNEGSVPPVKPGEAQGIILFKNFQTPGEGDTLPKIETALKFFKFDEIKEIKNITDAQAQLTPSRAVDLSMPDNINNFAKAIAMKINGPGTVQNFKDMDLAVIGGKRRGKSMRKHYNNGGTAKKHRKHRRKHAMNNN